MQVQCIFQVKPKMNLIVAQGYEPTCMNVAVAFFINKFLGIFVTNPVTTAHTLQYKQTPPIINVTVLNK